MDITHDANLKSFIETPSDSHFPLQNLPYGVFQRGGTGPAHIGVAIGDRILDLTVLEAHDLLDASVLRSNRPFSNQTLNAFMALGREAWTAARTRVHHLLRSHTSTLRDNADLCEQALVPMNRAEMLPPVDIGDYTDFYSSKEHATNVGTMFRDPANALLPNWTHLPVGYHGRAGSVVLSGTDIVRPTGQLKPDDAPPVFRPSRLLDFELEMGFFTGPGNDLGHPIPVARASDHIFGLVLVNDWSARDIQKWEYVPLGPFLAKSFATSISPWVVTLDALEPFRCEGPVQDPEPLPYLQTTSPWSYDIELHVTLQGANMDEGHEICRSNARYLYWNMAQQLAHHTSNGCNTRPGDLMASGTISGPTADSYGSLLELSWRGTRPLLFPNGEQRTFLQDGDRSTITGWAQGRGHRIGFGEVTGRILPPFEAV